MLQEVISTKSLADGLVDGTYGCGRKFEHFDVASQSVLEAGVSVLISEGFDAFPHGHPFRIEYTIPSYFRGTASCVYKDPGMVTKQDCLRLLEFLANQLLNVLCVGYRGAAAMQLGDYIFAYNLDPPILPPPSTDVCPNP